MFPGSPQLYRETDLLWKEDLKGRECLLLIGFAERVSAG